MDDENVNAVEENSISETDVERDDSGELEAVNDSENYEQIIGYVQSIDAHAETIVNVSIVCLVSFGIMIGVICTQIFSRYFSS